VSQVAVSGACHVTPLGSLDEPAGNLLSRRVGAPNDRGDVKQLNGGSQRERCPARGVPPQQLGDQATAGVLPGPLGGQQAASATGTYGSIRATFSHLVLSDGRYLRRLAGGAPAWVDRPEDAVLDELAAWAEEAGQLWERLLSEPVDPERVVVVDDGALEVRAGIIVAQALHHGNAHREQICAILTSQGIEPPDIQPWEYSWATGRIWERTAAR
jgi:uncharacterized damage-inducible protein DinB